MHSVTNTAAPHSAVLTLPVQLRCAVNKSSYCSAWGWYSHHKSRIANVPSVDFQMRIARNVTNMFETRIPWWRPLISLWLLQNFCLPLVRTTNPIKCEQKNMQKNLVLSTHKIVKLVCHRKIKGGQRQQLSSLLSSPSNRKECNWTREECPSRNRNSVVHWQQSDLISKRWREKNRSHWLSYIEKNVRSAANSSVVS